jgi:alpha-galactosidase
MGFGRLSDGLASTPPMGWNSWNYFKGNVDEALVIETAEAMVATGMRDAGYRYVVIDDGWMASERSGRGDLVADPTRFPGGIARVAERVHALGLLFGIYTDAGTKTCMGLPASLGYEFRDARAFADWGVDYVKVDWCHTDGMGARTLYAKWALAIAATRRRMVLSICEWGRSHPWTWAGTVGHLWRTCWDIQPEWSSVMTILDRQSGLHPYAGPGHWNDPDMLEVGNGDLTTVESKTHFAMWAMLAAPLMAGNDLRVMSDEVREILTARELVALDQDALGRQARPVRGDADEAVWHREVSGSALAVALLNRSTKARLIRVVSEELGIEARTKVRVRDLWTGEERDVAGEIAATVPAHGAAVLRVSSR